MKQQKGQFKKQYTIIEHKFASKIAMFCNFVQSHTNQNKLF